MRSPASASSLRSRSSNAAAPIARDVEDSRHTPVGTSGTPSSEPPVPSEVVADGLGSQDVVDADADLISAIVPAIPRPIGIRTPAIVSSSPDRGPHAELRALGVGQE